MCNMASLSSGEAIVGLIKASTSDFRRGILLTRRNSHERGVLLATEAHTHVFDVNGRTTLSSCRSSMSIEQTASAQPVRE